MKKIICMMLLLTTSYAIGADNAKNILVEQRENKIKGIISGLLSKSDEIKLKTINDFFNQEISFATDLKNWGEIDYWATPQELLAKGSGDCEDDAIAKFFSLLDSGIRPERLRLVYVNVLTNNIWQAHMVLAYINSSGTYVLDNLNSEILNLDSRPDLGVIFSFNQTDVWDKLSDNIIRNANQISQWKALQSRMPH